MAKKFLFFGFFVFVLFPLLTLANSQISNEDGQQLSSDDDFADGQPDVHKDQQEDANRRKRELHFVRINATGYNEEAVRRRKRDTPKASCMAKCQMKSKARCSKRSGIQDSTDRDCCWGKPGYRFSCF